MGDRGSIKMIEHSNDEERAIYFYTHWTGYKLPEIIQSALRRGHDRWEQSSYLNRIIFSEMIKNCVLDTTGYGISLDLIETEYELIEVFVDKQQVKIADVTYNFKDLANANCDMEAVYDTYNGRD
jgi:hypothetical protein